MISEDAVEAYNTRLTVDTSNLKKLTPAQRAHCARSLRSALHGFCVLEKDDGHPEPYALDNSLTQLVELFIRGIETLEPR